jgi:hypothetical protein
MYPSNAIHMCSGVGDQLAAMNASNRVLTQKLIEMSRELAEARSRAHLATTDAHRSKEVRRNTVEQQTGMLDRAFRFIAGLQLTDHPLAVQREARELVHSLAQALRPQCVVNDRAAAVAHILPPDQTITNMKINGVPLPAGTVGSITVTAKKL